MTQLWPCLILNPLCHSGNSIKYFIFCILTRPLKSGLSSTHGWHIPIWTSCRQALNIHMCPLSALLDAARVEERSRGLSEKTCVLISLKRMDCTGWSPESCFTQTFSESTASQGCRCVEKLAENGQAFAAGTIPQASLPFLPQFREIKKASSSLTQTAGSGQRLGSLSPTAKGCSGR